MKYLGRKIISDPSEGNGEDSWLAEAPYNPNDLDIKEETPRRMIQKKISGLNGRLKRDSLNSELIKYKKLKEKHYNDK